MYSLWSTCCRLVLFWEELLVFSFFENLFKVSLFFSCMRFDYTLYPGALEKIKESSKGLPYLDRYVTSEDLLHSVNAFSYRPHL